MINMETLDSKPPLFTSRSLLNLLLPIVLDSVLYIVAGLLDSIMVSSSGEAAVSGVSLVDSINMMLIMLFVGLGVGGTVITTQFIGSRNYTQARASANHLLYLSSGVALIISLFCLCFVPQILQLIYSNIAPDVFDYAKTYFYITLLGHPFYAIGTTCAALMRSMAKTRQSTNLTITVNLLNLFGNALLIFGFRMGVAGAALSTTLSRVIFAVVGLIMLHQKNAPIYFEELLKFRIDGKMMKQIFAIGITSSAQNGLFQLGKLLVSSLLATLGTVSIAAYSSAFSILNFGWAFISAFSTISLTVIGQCIGAREPKQAKENTNKLLRWCTITTIVAFGLLFLLRNYVVRLYAFDSETLNLSAYCVGAGAIFTVASFYAHFVIDGAALRAAGDIYFPLIVTIASMFIFRVGLSYLLVKVFHMGVIAIWIGMGVDWAANAFIYTLHKRNDKWLHKKLV